MKTIYEKMSELAEGMDEEAKRYFFDTFGGDIEKLKGMSKQEFKQCIAEEINKKRKRNWR